MANDSLVFLHLSDIHFRRWSGSTYDIDEDLRNELLLDASNVLKKVGQPHGILVTGDIAFSGVSDEYNIAKKWLVDICTRFGRSLENIWCIPCNHDVERSRIKQSPALEAIHTDLRISEQQCIDEKMIRYMYDSEAAELIFRPISEYNRFAAAFQCEINQKRPTWQQDFPLNDGSTLCVSGLNSTVFSDDLDDVHKNVPLGKYQIPKRVPGVVHLVMCHHPPDWWQDAESVEQTLNTRTTIQLFGHKHVKRLAKINSTLRLTAGAVHPDRRTPNWKPCYNWLKVSVSGTDAGRKLDVEIYPRTWNAENSKFIPDYNSCNGRDCCLVSLDLEPWASQPSEQNIPEQGSGVLGITPPSRPSIGLETEMLDPIRVLTYRFLDLAHVVRIDIARELSLLRDEDEGLEDYKLFSRVLTRAAQEKLLAQLWDKIEERHGDKKYTSNPFRGQ
jgi:hypothetical protein